MQLTVARIGRAHGLRGEVALDLRTDNPEDRFGVGAVLATEPAARGPLTVVSTRTQQDRWYVTFAQITDRTTAEAMRGTELVVEEDTSDEDDAWYPHELAGLRAEHVDGTRARRDRRPRAPAGARHAGPARARRRAHAVPFVQGDRAGRRRRRRSRRARPARWPARLRRGEPRGLRGDRAGTTTDVRIDVVSIFPEYLAPLELSLVGKARTTGLLDLRVHDLRDWTTDRHRTVDDTPFGGGAGMVMRPDVWGTALDELLDDRRAPAGADAVGGAVHAAHRRGARRREPPGAGLRSVRGDRRPRGRALPRARVTRHRVLDRRLRAQRRRGRGARRRRGRRAPAARASSATPSRWSRSPTGRPGCSSTPSTPSRPPGPGWRCPRCCCPGTTRGSRGGAGTPRCERTAARRPDLVAALPRRRARHARPRACWRRSAGCRSTDGSRERDLEHVIYRRCALRVADLPVGARRLRLCHRGDDSRPPGLSTRTHRTIRPRTPVLPCTGRPRRPRRRS